MLKGLVTGRSKSSGYISCGLNHNLSSDQEMHQIT